MKKLLYLSISVLTFGLVTFFFLNEKLPKGKAGAEAEALADKMLSAVNIQGWDSITAIKWTFRDSHHYLWHKQRNLVQIEWDDNRVLLNTNSQRGLAWSNEVLVEHPEQKNKLIQTAWAYFANDSFWFSAPFKIKDPGTEHKLVETDDGAALLVTYTSGGVTPGDSYLWMLDENGLPIAWKMWVNILPIGGLQFSWTNWNTYSFNTKIATAHRGVIDVPINNLETAAEVKKLTNGSNPFEGFE